MKQTMGGIGNTDSQHAFNKFRLAFLAPYLQGFFSKECFRTAQLMPFVFPTDRKSAHAAIKKCMFQLHKYMFITAQIYLELHFCVELHDKKTLHIGIDSAG